MFCPGCGLENTESSQYCRSCGSDLRTIRTVFKSPDRTAAFAVSSRDAIERSIAVKIQQAESSAELADFAEDVLPEIKKFLESPEEQKMRRIRNGSILSFIGLGVMIGFTLASQLGGDAEIIIVAALGLVTFFIGLAFLVNGLLFTVPKNYTGNKVIDEPDSRGDSNDFSSTTNELLVPPNAQREFTSVTEPTTRHLKDKKPVKNG